MSEKTYIEDIFLDFFSRCLNLQDLSSVDSRVMSDFYVKISNSEELTQNQANYLLRLMSKYQDLGKSQGLDLNKHLETPIWKKPFRILDQTKQAYIDKNADGVLQICLRFPYSFKNIFEKELDATLIKKSFWDSDEKLRKIDLYNCNIIHLHEFLRSNGFQIEESFMDAVSYAEEVWNEQDKILPHVVVENDAVVLRNAVQDAENYFQTHRTNNTQKDLFLAKSMGFLYNTLLSKNTNCEKIASTDSNQFWFKDLDQFLKLHIEIDGITAILLDRNTENIVSWLTNFVNCCDINGIPRSHIKVCFREPDSKNSKLNSWIKENSVGGEVKDGKILIFLHKPPKWIFKNKLDIKLIGLNNFTPISEPLSASWIESHHCSCYISSIKPTKARGREIAEL